MIDAEGAPGAALRALVEALDQESWASTLAAALHYAYGSTLAGLETATPAQLNQRIQDKFGVTGEACRRSVTFLLTAAQDARLTISPYLVAPPRSRGRLFSSRARASVNGDAPELLSNELLAARLIEKLPDFDPAWPDALQENWFKQFNELIRLAQIDLPPTQFEPDD